jgi:dUTP pyrophosphatase
MRFDPNVLRVAFKKLHEKAKVPSYATDGSGAFDLYAATVQINEPSFGVHTFGLGFALEIPEGYGMFILSRSGHGFKNQMRLTNCVGLIDSDYRGEVKVQLIVDTHQPDFLPDSSKAIAQGVILPIPKVEFYTVDELSETVRGAGGLGSTSL